MQPAMPPAASTLSSQTAALILERQPVGTLVVDERTVVRFANPAAAELLGVPLERLLGQAFGLPLAANGVTDVNVTCDDGTVCTLAMQVTPIAAGRQLVSLFDVSGRARLYEHEHRLVESLQRSLLLDRMPQLPGISLAARYVAGDDVARVGGDWYDVIPLRDGRLGLAIGDVAGHGVDSAALMSQLRNALRAYALEHSSPAEVVQRLDQLIAQLEPLGMATLAYLVYDRGAAELTFTAAGHPYPLLIGPDGRASFLRGGRSLPLGTGLPEARDESRVRLPGPGSTLVLYTDGLVERRSRQLDDRLRRLAEVRLPPGADPEEACDRILGELLGDGPPMDDVALLVMRADAA
jgi:serine phosphatase RsbU (regulator of sigma subunit)